MIRRNFSAISQTAGFKHPLPLDARYDLVTSQLDLHNQNDVPGALIQIRHSLKPDGLFLGALFGQGSLAELRDSLAHADAETYGTVFPRVHPFPDKVQMAGLMQRAGFALPVVDSETVTVTYADIHKLMHDLRGMGQGNLLCARRKTFERRALFAKASAHYARNHSESDGRLVATFNIIFLLGWAPAQSQPKPLKRGSAEMRLEDALNKKG